MVHFGGGRFIHLIVHAECVLAKIVLVCLGIVVAAVIGCVITASIGHYTTSTIPTWLPPIPFAVVAVMLFVLGALAWSRGDRKADDAHGTRADS